MGEQSLWSGLIHVALLTMITLAVGACLLGYVRAKHRVKRVGRCPASQAGEVAPVWQSREEERRVATDEPEQVSGQGDGQRIPNLELDGQAVQPTSATKSDERKRSECTCLDQEPQDSSCITATKPLTVAAATLSTPTETSSVTPQPPNLTQAQEEPEAPSGARSREPSKRGGRSRVTERTGGHPSLAKSVPLVKPEIVCWRRERQWFVGVEAPDEGARRQGLEVLQDGEPLERDPTELESWRLAKVGGEIVARWEDRGRVQERTISVRQDHLLFKLSGRDRGRHVKCATSRDYVAIVPDCWVRDNDLSGPPFAEPEPVAIDGYKAHFFSVETSKSTQFVFRTPDGQQVVAETRKTKFELSGKVLTDASEREGPLFEG